MIVLHQAPKSVVLITKILNKIVIQKETSKALIVMRSLLKSTGEKEIITISLILLIVMAIHHLIKPQKRLLNS
jgi:hypothetical protein